MPNLLAPEPNDLPTGWLSSTRLLDLDNPKLRIQAMRLTQLADTSTQKVVAIHAFVKSLPFGCVAAFTHVLAADVLRSRRGDCHTKGVLFVALLRCVGLPARLRFVSLSSDFLRGIISLPKMNVVHAIGEVFLDGRWIQTDAYVTDTQFEVGAQKLLVQEGRQLGYGIHRDGTHQWDGFHDAHGQTALADAARWPLQDWGVAHDPEQFYANTAEPSLRIGWPARLKWVLAASVVNRRADWVRLHSADTP